MLKSGFQCWLKPVLWKFLSISVWNHYAAKLDVRVLMFFGWALNHMLSAVPIAMRGCGSLGSYSECSLMFFRLAALNLRVDSCMFENRFLMLAERLALGISLLFFLESLWVKGCFLLFFWISA
jgi:hypothetical protein